MWAQFSAPWTLGSRGVLLILIRSDLDAGYTGHRKDNWNSELGGPCNHDSRGAEYRVTATAGARGARMRIRSQTC